MSSLLSLKACRTFPKWFWRSDEETIAAAGIAKQFDHIPLADEDVRYVGIIPFDKGEKPFFFAPRYTLGEKQKAVFTRGTVKMLVRDDFPSFDEWEEKVSTILDKIAAGEVEKVVLARQTTIYCDYDIDVYRLMHNLIEQQPGTHFMMQFDQNNAFLGATPEKLYSRKGNELIIDSLAGSHPRGTTKEKDLHLEKKLLKSMKELREFACVRDDLIAKMQTISRKVHAPTQLEVLKLPHIQHLRQQIAALIKEGVRDRDLIELLHPTAAMGGLPREIALSLLKELEPFPRRWYAAPFGWMTKERAEFVVAIRSALIEGKRAHLYAATGIVAGSDPKREWEELNCKIEGMMHALLY